MKTLLYANRAEPKSISVISILLLAAVAILLNYVACIGSVISLLRKIFAIIIIFDTIIYLIINKIEHTFYKYFK